MTDTTPQKPRTEAGRALFADKFRHPRSCSLWNYTPMPCDCSLRQVILAIEDEAATPVVAGSTERLRAGLGTAIRAWDALYEVEVELIDEQIEPWDALNDVMNKARALLDRGAIDEEG
jgi:hypothetical protein